MIRKLKDPMNAGHYLWAVLMLAMLPSCSSDSDVESATQVVAKVDSDEISVHQLNFILSRTQVTSEAEAKDLSQQVVKNLVDESLMVKQAKTLKLDRDPDVLLAMENAKRQVLAQAWAEMTVKDIGEPSEQEVKAFYLSHPELFEQHKIYQLKELVIDQIPGNQPTIDGLLKANDTIDALADSLKKQKIKFKQNLSIQPAEKLPLEQLAAISKLNQGRFISFRKEDQLQVLGVLSAKDDPIKEDKAQPFIKSFLSNSKKKEKLEQTLAELRKNAKINYLGDFSDINQASEKKTPSQIGAELKAEPEDFISKGVTGLK